MFFSLKVDYTGEELEGGTRTSCHVCYILNSHPLFEWSHHSSNQVSAKIPFFHFCDLMSQWFRAESSVSFQVWDLASDAIEFQNLLSLHLQGYPFLLVR